jgi:hydrogenase maturation protease
LKTIILGLGNPSYCDDAAGLLVARGLKPLITGTEVTVEEATVAGMDVPDIISGYDKAIIIDAAQTPAGQPGSLFRIDYSSQVENPISDAHYLDFLTSIRLGRRSELPLPQEITIIGIEAEDIYSIKEECTPLVRAAVTACIEMVLCELGPVTQSGDIR